MKVWSLYRWFCYAIALLNIILAGTGAWMVSNANLLQNETVLTEVIAKVGWLAVGVGVLFALLNVGITLVPIAPWAYGIHYANLLLACCTLVLLPAALPLTFLWSKPETKAFFGVGTSPPSSESGGFQI
jgi:uncharacterized membrane protein